MVNKFKSEILNPSNALVYKKQRYSRVSNHAISETLQINEQNKNKRYKVGETCYLMDLILGLNPWHKASSNLCDIVCRKKV
jgi:hypothetical protein